MGVAYKKNSKYYKLTEVISIVSHQLKTPLSAIKGYLEVLISEEIGNLNNYQKEYLRDTLENTQRMIKLVKDLLDVSQIEQGRIKFNLKPTRLEEIVKETIREFSSFAKAKNCTLSFKCSENIPILKIDPLKIKQVVANLISNAIEYTEKKGEVEVGIKRKGNKVMFFCQDTGIGIPSREKKKIFTKFYRSEKAITLSTGGSGLGLFISKAIIKESGGKIWFESKKGKGSTFYFTLPIE